MIFAIIHRYNEQGILAKEEATNIADAALQYIRHNPELECDSVMEFQEKFPILADNLAIVPLQ